MMGLGGYGYFYGAPLPYFFGAGFFDINKKEVIYITDLLLFISRFHLLFIYCFLTLALFESLSFKFLKPISLYLYIK
jgi:hypothetical protein